MQSGLDAHGSMLDPELSRNLLQVNAQAMEQDVMECMPSRTSFRKDGELFAFVCIMGSFKPGELCGKFHPPL